MQWYFGLTETVSEQLKTLPGDHIRRRLLESGPLAVLARCCRPLQILELEQFDNVASHR